MTYGMALCVYVDALLHCLFGSSTTQTSGYELKLRDTILELETELELELRHSKDKTLAKNERLRHFRRAKQLEESLRNRNSQLAILAKAQYSKEESQSRRAFLKVIRGAKLPGIDKVEGMAEQVYDGAGGYGYILIGCCHDSSTRRTSG